MSNEEEYLGMSTWPCIGEVKGGEHAFPPERPSAVSLLGRMGDWTCDRNREPAHLAEYIDTLANADAKISDDASAFAA
jgi:hypothetical protein